MYLIETIEDYFNSVGTGCPVSTDDIFNYAKSFYPDVNRAVFNEYMTRVCARNPLIKRYQRGVYYKTEETEEGYAEVKMDELLKKTYLGEGDNVIGYVTGPAYMYNMAFTNDFYDELIVATNNYRSQAMDFENVKLIKPIIPVTSENYKYLQILDVLHNRWNVQLRRGIIKRVYRHIRKNGLDFEKLLVYSMNYPNKGLQRIIAQVAVYGAENNE